MKVIMDIDDLRAECGYDGEEFYKYQCTHPENDYCTAAGCPLARLMEIEDEKEFFPKEYEGFKKEGRSDDEIRNIIQDYNYVVVDK